MKKILLIILLFSLSQSQLLINEIDYDQPGTDSTEYLELIGEAGTYNNVVVSLINGNNNSSYNSFSLGNITLANETDGFGFYVIGVPSVPNVDFSDGFPATNAIQNGSPDGIELWVNGVIVDAVVYEGSMNDANGNPMEEVDASFYEGLDGLSISRDGLDNFGWSVTNITPGAINENQIVDANANIPPVANAGDNQTVGSGDEVTLDASGSYDSNGDIVFYEWTQLSGTPVSLSDSESSITTFTAPETSGELIFQVTVYDDEFVSDTDETSVIVCGSGLSTIAEARALGLDQCVAVQGIVISPNFQSNSSEFAIQDDTGGLILFAPGLMLDLAIGDEVHVMGVTDEYNGKFEVIVESEDGVTNMGPGVLPAVQLITVSDLETNGEEFESELIQILSVGIVSGDWPDEGSSSNLTVTDDGSAMTTMRIDSDTEIDGSPEPSWPQNVTGVAGQYDFAEPFDSGYQLMPRFISDFENASGPVAIAGEDQMVEPGANVTLDGSASYSSESEIIGYLWTQEEGTTVSLSASEESIVTFSAPAEPSELVFSITVFDANSDFSTDFVTISVVQPISIYDVQYSNSMGEGDDCFPSPLTGQSVTVTGIVTAVRDNETYPNFFIQDIDDPGFSGIYVYVDFGFEMLSVNDEVTLTADVNEFFGTTQLEDVGNYSVMPCDCVVEPTELLTSDLGLECSSSAEMYEGMLVTFSDVEVLSLNEFNSWFIDDGSGQTKVDDYFFSGDWSVPNIGDTFASITGIVHYYQSEYVVYPRSIDDIVVTGDCVNDGDVSGDGSLDVLDIVAVVAHVLGSEILPEEVICHADMNDSGEVDVLDIVAIVDIILNPGVRGIDADSAKLIIENGNVKLKGNGFIGGIQMTIIHDVDFNLEFEGSSFIAESYSQGNSTKLLIIHPDENLFTYFGQFEVVEMVAVSRSSYIDIEIAKNYTLLSNHPNPFNPETEISYMIEFNGDVQLVIYDLMGREIKTLVNEFQMEGISYSISWDGKNTNGVDVPSGIYFTRLISNNQLTTKKITLMR